MAKISPVSIKYMIHATFVAEGALEKPDVIGALFGQTEGLLGVDLEMRELQKEGKIGRIEVDLERSNKQTRGNIQVPTALDQPETTLIAAAIETIERIGPSDAEIEVEKIEDVRGSKRDYIIERAKELMKSVEGSTDSREISGRVKDDSRTSDITEYGKEKLPAGDLSEKEIIVVEGRADVLNLMRNRIKNVIAMNGTKLPETVKELSNEKDVILFVDGDRGGQLIVKNVVDNAKVKYIAMAPDGKEVEELNGKEILMQLRKKVSPEEFLGKSETKRRDSISLSKNKGQNESSEKELEEKKELTKEEKDELKNISVKNTGSRKAILLNDKLKKIKTISARSLSGTLKKFTDNAYAIVIDGIVTEPIIRSSEESGIKLIVAKNFSTTDTKIKLLSL